MSGAPLVDTHAHLQMADFDADRAEALGRARASGVRGFAVVGTNLADSAAALRLAESENDCLAACGIHPHEAEAAPAGWEGELRALLASPRAAAVGEIGLDYHRDLSPRPLQRRLFEAQLALASELSLPVVIHVREAWDDAFAVLAGFPGRALLHCFSGAEAELEKALAAGFLISFPGAATYHLKKGDRHPLNRVAAAVPAGRYVLETDCPWITPVPRKGRNEPAYLPHVAEAVARLRGETVETVASATTAAAAAFFGKGADAWVSASSCSTART